MTHVSIKKLTKIYPGSTEPSLDNLSIEIEFFVKIISDPSVNKIAKKEKIIKLKINVKFPNCISLLFFAYLEKSP